MDESTQRVLGSLIRHGLTIVGTYLVSKQLLDPNDASTLMMKIASDATLALPVVWGAVGKMDFEWGDLFGRNEITALKLRVDALERRVPVNVP